MTTEITFRTVELVVEGNYTPEEPQVSYYEDISGIPSSPSEFEIDNIKAIDSETDLFALFSFADIEEIENLCLIKIEE